MTGNWGRKIDELYGEACKGHGNWVNGGGLRKGDPGPLDKLALLLEDTLKKIALVKPMYEEE